MALSATAPTPRTHQPGSFGAFSKVKGTSAFGLAAAFMPRRWFTTILAHAAKLVRHQLRPHKNTYQTFAVARALRRLSRRRGNGEPQALAPSDDGERAWLFADTHPVEDAPKMLGGTDCRIIHRQQHVTY